MRIVWLFNVLLSLFVFQGCVQNTGNRILYLVEELGIHIPVQLDSCFLIYIPGNGCRACIQEAVYGIRECEDTLYVFGCNTDKDFFLQTGKKASLFSNLVLDKKNIANQVQIGTTYPVVYLFTEGKYESSWPFSLKKRA